MGGDRAESLVPSLLEEIIETGAWRDRQDANGKRFTFGKDAFRAAVTDPAPKGLDVTLDAVRKYLGDSTNPLRVRFEAMVERNPGSPTGHPEVPRGQCGKFTVVHPDDNDTVIPNAIRDNGDTPKPRVRDRSREPQAGTSVGYTVRRLEREAANDPAAARRLRQAEGGRDQRPCGGIFRMGMV